MQSNPATSTRVRSPARLADLIAAIQVMGTYRFAVRRLHRWEKRLGRTPLSAGSWLDVFMEHPEFFTVIREDGAAHTNDPNAALVWRRSKERNYDTHAHAVVPWDIAIGMAAEDREAEATRLSRAPLDSSEISLLVNLAVELHERELKHKQERRWWYAVMLALAGMAASLVSHFF